MNNEKMGQFISELRKSNHMTQKDLAEKLNITDKAVSKWERGLSCPDISLLSSIADILGITTDELLNGQKSKDESIDNVASLDNALHYADKVVKSKEKIVKNLYATTFSLLLLLGAIVCAICDLAITGTFTWSLLSNSSIVFSWLVLYPIIKFGKKGILYSIIAISILIIPFLYVLDNLINSGELFLPIGIRMAFISIVFLWLIFTIFKKLSLRILLAFAISFLLVIPFNMIANAILSKLISEPLLDVWDFLSFSIIGIIAMVLFVSYLRNQTTKAN